jgi:hypothetical protein
MAGAMRRPVLRILLNAATVLSLVLCVATMAAWVRSYQASDWVEWSMARPRQALMAYTYLGGLHAGVIKPVGTPDGLDPPGPGWIQGPPMGYADAGCPQGTLFNRFGFGLEYAKRKYYEARFLACPYWFILLLMAILPAARLAGWRRRRRRRRWARRLRMGAELCQHCGYDCRATPQGGRCPECGTPVAAAR